METQKYRHMISVVVPVYNAQEYLAVMIESLLNQSYAKWELILVENGSRDGSFEICTMYEKKDRRICVVQERKKGVSAARNSGLKMARGEYILFVDADDFLPDSNVLHPRTAGVSMHSGLKPIWYMLRMFFSVLAVIFRCKVLKVDENVGLEDIDAKMDKLKQEELKMEELHHTKRKKAELKSQS